MIAASGSFVKPLTLQSPTGTYGTVPAPTGSTLSRPTLTAPKTLTAPSQSPPAAGSPAPAPTTAAPPRFMPPPVNVNPIPTGTSQFQPPPAAAPSVPRGNTPAGTTAVSGDEVPYHIGAGPSDQSSGLLSRLASEAGRQLDQPTVFDDPLAKQIKDSQVAGVNANYDEAGKHLDARLADRGINYSTIAGGDIMDLEKQRAGALSSIDADIAEKRATSLAAGRSAAFNNARGVFGDSSQTDQTTRNNQVGERDYTDQLRNKAQSDALATTQLGETYGRQNDQDFQSILDRVYQQGNGSQGGAANIYGGQAGVYGSSAAEDQGGLADLAQLAARYFGSGS